MHWIRAKLRGKSVFVRATDTGQPLVQRGRVEVVYRRNYPKIYRASPGNLEDIDPTLLDESEAPTATGAAAPKSKSDDRPVADGSWEAWTDGACSGNPGPAGLGVVLFSGDMRWELSEYLGRATNNIAELTAILRALQKVPDTQPLVLHTDSQYSIGVLKKGWKAKANKELIAELRSELRRHASVDLRYVKGHAGEPLNERADELARRAVSDRSTEEQTIEQGKQTAPPIPSVTTP